MGYEELQIENERLKKDISELEIMHKIEIDVLKKEIAELKSVESIEKTFGDFVSGKTPMEIALSLINASVKVPETTILGIKISEFDSLILKPAELREIASYLEVYCNFRDEEETE